MKKIEMIRVRSSLNTITEVMPSLIDYTEKMKMGLLEGEVEIMHHSLNKGDLAVFLVWENARDQRKSREGVLVAEILQDFGALTHVIWLEDQGVKRSHFIE